MATRFGHQLGEQLVEIYGWLWDDTPMPDDHFGDRWVVDPVTKTRMSPHEAWKLQQERNTAAQSRPLPDSENPGCD